MRINVPEGLGAASFAPYPSYITSPFLGPYIHPHICTYIRIRWPWQTIWTRKGHTGCHACSWIFFWTVPNSA